MKKSLIVIIILIALALPVRAVFVPVVDEKFGVHTGEGLQNDKIEYLLVENEQLKSAVANLSAEIVSIKNDVKETKTLIDVLLGLLKQLQTLLMQLFTKLTK